MDSTRHVTAALAGKSAADVIRSLQLCMMQPQGKHMTFQPCGLKNGTPPTNKCHSICPPDCYLQNLSHSRCLLRPVSLPACLACLQMMSPQTEPRPDHRISSTSFFPWSVPLKALNCFISLVCICQHIFQPLGPWALGIKHCSCSRISHFFSLLLLTLEDDRLVFNKDRKISPATLSGIISKWLLGLVCVISLNEEAEGLYICCSGRNKEEAAADSAEYAQSKQVDGKVLWVHVTVAGR